MCSLRRLISEQEPEGPSGKGADVPSLEDVPYASAERHATQLQRRYWLRHEVSQFSRRSLLEKPLYNRGVQR